MSRLKNYQSEVELQMLVVHAFHGTRMKSYVELTEGFCNVAYKIELEDGRTVILKIGPKSSEFLMSYEINMMQAEVTAMNLVREKTDILLPDVYFYDNSKTLCQGDYFFMECLEGVSFNNIKDDLSNEEREAIDFVIGRNVNSLHKICGDKFGLLGAMESWQEEFFSFFYQLVVSVLHDGLKKNIDIGADYEEIRSLLLRDKAVFEEVKTSVLIHWDTWEGNWFINDLKITGLIDWERAMWGEPLMEERFRCHCLSESFLRGYGKVDFTKSETRRLAWYDIYLYLIMMIEGSYREYDNDGQYQWAKANFLAVIEKIR